MKNKTAELVSITVPAGNYWLTDPCYVIRNNEDWWKVCDSFDENGNVCVKLDNGSIVAAFSVNNDGCYTDQNNNNYYVDSGTIGLVSVDYNPDYNSNNSGQMIEFHEDTVCSLEDNYLTFGEIVIDLEPDNDYSYED